MIAGKSLILRVFGRFQVTRKKECEGSYFDAGNVAYIEETLGYKLPESYLSFMKRQKSGIPIKGNSRTATPTS
ncbi:hypothetical protein A5888_003579 [Enterococcus sp. 9E7_DIV0242]|uniref:SMI1/KNR4 family protein n=1 Tax=Candidatus Enterococcus clewellii TaxID=1834193 RepID=A0A242JX55_9ENTE|nr:hypothetical protein A5888_004008 [Enterococcus sp. 9E7_DIV0242]